MVRQVHGDHFSLLSMVDTYDRKLLIWIIKVIPTFLSLISVIYMILSLLGINCGALSILVGSSLLSTTILLLFSFIFKFCFYHRIFIYYLYIIQILNLIDWYILIDISSKWLTSVSLILFISCAITALYLYMKKHEIRIIKTRT